jgi:antitoxin CptB
VDDEASFGRLRWQCRRGMRELDVVLERWLETRYAEAGAGERQAFRRLLDAQDPELIAWLFCRERPSDPGVATLVDELASCRR